MELNEQQCHLQPSSLAQLRGNAFCSCVWEAVHLKLSPTQEAV
jgi:hypothetical protein